MAITAVTSRDRLAQLGDLVGKTMRYWYLLAIFAIAGGALSFAFAMTRPKIYQSWTTLYYAERVDSSLLSGRQEEVQKNLGDRYRELLLARAMLEQVVHDPKLDPYPEMPDEDEKIEKLRQAVRFEARGTNTFRINFSDVDPARAQAVTAKLTELLKDKDEELRNEVAQATVDFATKQKNESGDKLRKSERALVDFLSKHPEFVADPNQPQGEGAGIRKENQKQKAGNAAPIPQGSGRLYVLERQAARIKARLDAPPDAPPVRVSQERTPEQKAADAQVSLAQSEVQAAQRAIEDAQSKGYTEKHPEMLKALERMNVAKAKLADAKAKVPPDADVIVVPATAEDRAALQKQYDSIESQIADEQRRLAGGTQAVAPKPVTPAVEDESKKIVDLETEHDQLRHDVDQLRKADSDNADTLYKANISAAQKKQEQDRLSVIDPAFKPAKPGGPPKSIFLMAGMVLFVGLGLALAVGLAVIDDRLYRRHDIDALGIAVLAVIPPAGRAPAVKKKK